MTSKEGGFFSAEDADSPVVAGGALIRRSLGEGGDPGMGRPQKAHSISGRKKKSTRHWAMPRRFSISIMASQPHGNAPGGKRSAG